MPVITRPLILIGLLNVAISTLAADGYLPAVGPAPLRFIVPPPALAKATFVLPPLALPPAPVVADEPPSPQASIEGNPLTGALPPEPILTAPVIMPGTLTPEPRLELVPEIGSLTPQMFMQFFTGHLATNSSAVGVYTPVSFVPPAPIQSPSSSAAFETTPPTRP